jgi:hypothetical protein
VICSLFFFYQYDVPNGAIEKQPIMLKFFRKISHNLIEHCNVRNPFCHIRPVRDAIPIAIFRTYGTQRLGFYLFYQYVVRQLADRLKTMNDAKIL